MTKLTYTWSNKVSSKIFKTYSEVVKWTKANGGTFKINYIEGKDVDYVAPNPNTKRFAQRLHAWG